jgi:peptide/nickel transport system substrate-binding protein
MSARAGRPWRLAPAALAWAAAAVLCHSVAGPAWAQSQAGTVPPGTPAVLAKYQGKQAENGGSFVRALPADAVTLNPVIASDQISFLVYKWIFDPLLDMDSDMKPVGVLAESWKNSPDNRTTTFHLRKGVRWHDGKPFTADDVVFTYEACMDPKVDAINKRPAFEPVAKVEKVDELTVRVTWTKPYAPGLAAWVLYIMPKHVYGYPRGKGEEFNKNPKNAAPVGTGPFLFGEWRRGDRVVLNANADYFAGRPHLDQIVFRTIPQGQTQFAAYKTGQLSLTNLTAEQWKEVASDPAFARSSWIFEYPSRQFFYIGWNMDGSNPFFADRRVRQAMTYAMNRQGVVAKILDGHGQVATGPFYPGGYEYNPAVKPYPYDAAKAAALLDEAGWKDIKGTGVREKDGMPLSFECLVPAEVDMFSRWLEIFQQDLRRVGVEMKIRKVEWSVFLDRTNRHQFQACLSGWNLGDDPDPFQLLHSSQGKLMPSGTGVGQNDVSYANPAVDRLIEEEQSTFDREARRKALWKIHELVAEDQPHTYLLFGSQMTAVKNRYQGVEVSRAGYGLFTWYPSLLAWWVPSDMRK